MNYILIFLLFLIKMFIFIIMKIDNIYNEVIRLRKLGYTMPKISVELGVSKATIHKYLSIAYDKNDLLKTRIFNISKESLENAKNKKLEISNSKLMNEPFDTLSWDRIRKRVRLEQDGKCNRCDNDTWLGEKLVLEVDHKDGNNTNNDRENLEALCPNCHSLTSTWRGRNRKDKKTKISDIELLEALKVNDGNIRQALLSLGLAAKGGNYKRVYNLITEN